MENTDFNDPKYYVELPNEKNYLVTSHTHNNENWCIDIADFTTLRGETVTRSNNFIVKRPLVVLLNRDLGAWRKASNSTTVQTL